MTNNEQKSINEVYALMSKIREENQKFREDINLQVTSTNKQVAEKHIPIVLENEINNAINSSITKALTDSLGGYGSPLTKYAQNVVAKHQVQIEGIFDSVIQDAIGTAEFKQRVREVLLNKIAKVMISGVDGTIDKTINLMKQDAIFRSRLTLSVNALVDEFLNKK
jgi:hypothetical protein